MKDLSVYMKELMEASEDTVFAVVDKYGEVQIVCDTEEDAKEFIKEMPKEAEGKVEKTKRSEVEKKK